MRSLSRDTDALLRRSWNAMRLLLGLALLAAGCTKPNPASCADNHCSDPARPFCDVDGTIGGEPETCIAVSCTPNEFTECRGDAALTCNQAGNNYDLLECEFGCGEMGCKTPPDCTTLDCMKHIIPKYLPTICDTLATDAALDITSDLMESTQGGCTSVVAQTSGPEICVRHYGTIAIEPNVVYRPYGSRAIALVADTDLLVKGVLDVSGNIDGAPGGGLNQSGSPTAGAGGGGAGNRTAGGPGATTSLDGGGANQGPAEAHPDTRAALVGGNRSSAYNNGGGAATLISCRGRVSVSGAVRAGGAGGPSGYFNAQFQYVQAVGGGAGGNVVVQGMAIDISGGLFSNGGGGGGAGDQLNGTTAGQPGQNSVAAASGGNSDGGGGIGGTGGALGLAPGAGKKGTSGGGGGGGSTGFLLTYTPTGVTPTVATTAVISPALEANGTVPTN
jgi:hypothetical protein